MDCRRCGKNKAQLSPPSVLCYACQVIMADETRERMDKATEEVKKKYNLK